MNLIKDQYGRTFKTLRVSLTQVCNLGCLYCVDEAVKASDVPSLENYETRPPLSSVQLIDIITRLHETLNLETVRLTGGEPTLFKDLVSLTEGIRLAGIRNIKMTSNGSLLAPKVEALHQAGLTSINISLDAIDPDVYFKVSRRRNLKKILDGIEKAVALGIEVKINSVIMKGLNVSQILPLLNFAKQLNISIRFLELMQMGHLYHNFGQYFFPEHKIIETIAEEYSFVSLPRDVSATAKYFLLADGYRFGVISNESDPFCNDCNRLRLDNYGNLYGCLSNSQSFNVVNSLDDKNSLNAILNDVLALKKLKFSGSSLSMLAIGG